MNRSHIVILLTAIPLVFGCEEQFDEASDRARLEKMEQDIVAVVGDPRCQSDDSCRFIGLGAKPCGGPWRYLIYSVATVDSVELADRVREYNDFNRMLNRRHAWRSDCSLAPVPNVGCRNGTCVNVGRNP